MITIAQAGSLILMAGFALIITAEFSERISTERGRQLMDYGITLFFLGAAACAIGSWLPGSWR